MQAGRSSLGYSHFGQQIDTDICTGFESSFPHGFTSMTNFVDRWGHETFIYFMTNQSSAEVSSCLNAFHSSVVHRLKDGKIGRWAVDNGMSFHGDEVTSLCEALVERRGFQVPYESNTHAVAERNWGVLERMMRSDLAQAAAPACLTGRGPQHNRTGCCTTCQPTRWIRRHRRAISPQTTPRPQTSAGHAQCSVMSPSAYQTATLMANSGCAARTAATSATTHVAVRTLCSYPLCVGLAHSP